MIECIDDKNILFLHVNAGNDTPYYYIDDGVLETFVRVGNESVVADSTEHKRLVLRGQSGIRNRCNGLKSQNTLKEALWRS